MADLFPKLDEELSLDEDRLTQLLLGEQPVESPLFVSSPYLCKVDGQEGEADKFLEELKHNLNRDLDLDFGSFTLSDDDEEQMSVHQKKPRCFDIQADMGQESPGGEDNNAGAQPTALATEAGNPFSHLFVLPMTSAVSLSPSPRSSFERSVPQGKQATGRRIQRNTLLLQGTSQSGDRVLHAPAHHGTPVTRSTATTVAFSPSQQGLVRIHDIMARKKVKAVRRARRGRGGGITMMNHPLSFPQFPN